MRTKVIASVLNNIQTDQRLHKVCTTLQNNGFDVLLIGATLGGEPILKKPFATKLLPLVLQRSFLMYLEFNVRLLCYLLFLPKKNCVLLANDLDTLLPNVIVAKLFGLKVVYDSHEIFTEMPSLQNRKIKKRTWSWLEFFLLPKVDAFYTVSRSYAKWFNAKYKVKPVVVRNLPIAQHFVSNVPPETPLPIKLTNQKVMLYQGSLNVSRGLELLIDAMHWVKDAQFWIVGDGPIKNQLIKQSKSKELINTKVFFLGKIKPDELKKITPLVDLGVSLEQDNGLSYRYALPNKLFDYVHAGVPVLASDLNEVVTLLRKYKIGNICRTQEPKEIAQLITEMLTQGKAKYQTNLQQAALDLNWEKDANDLLGVFNAVKATNK